MKRRNATKRALVRGAGVAKRVAKPPRRHGASPKRSDDTADALIDAAAQALGLTIDPAWRDGVTFHFRLVLSHAARVDAFRLPDDAEPAPIFHA